VGDFILSYFPMGGGGSAEAQAVVSWNGGELNENELTSLRRIHALTIDYLDRIITVTVDRGGSPKGAGVSRDQSGRFQDPGISRDGSDLRLVRTMLLAEQAEKIGMEVPDDAIYEFLAQLSDRMLSSDEMRSTLAEATNKHLTRDQLFDNLRRELLARNYLRLVASGDVMTPDDAWSYYNRLNRRVTTSILAFPAEKYLDRAPQPSKSEVQAVYDKYKDQYPFPESPDPGFKQRPLYKFAYFKASYDKFIEEEKQKFSAEEVQKYYDEHKETYKVPELPATETDVKTESGAAASETPGDDATTPDLTSPENTTLDPDAKPESSPSEAAPAKSEEGDSKENTSAPKAENEQSPDEGALLPQSAFHVALLAAQDEPAAEAPADPATSEPADDAAPKDTAAEGATDDAAAEPGKEKTTDDAAKKEPKYQPLAEVEDDIRRSLATQPARERMDEALMEARRHIDRYKRAHASYRARIEAGGEAKAPAEPDYEEIALELGLEYGQTPMVNQLTVGETELGKTFIFGPGFQQYTFAQVAMGEQATLHQAQRIQGMDDYVYWATDFKESRTPPLEEIREEVVRAWRLQKALEIAIQEAEKTAQVIRKAPKEAPLADAAGVQETAVIRPPGFSWMTQGATAFGGAGAPYVSDVPGVDGPGFDFMETVFQLQPGEVGVAPNEPKTIAYLVRLEDETPGEEVLRDLFWQSGIQFNVQVQYVARLEQQRKIFAWIEEFEKDWGLEWKRPPQSYAG
jgi:hypothetical protein